MKFPRCSQEQEVQIEYPLCSQEQEMQMALAEKREEQLADLIASNNQLLEENKLLREQLQFIAVDYPGE